MHFLEGYEYFSVKKYMLKRHGQENVERCLARNLKGSS